MATRSDNLSAVSPQITAAVNLAEQLDRLSQPLIQARILAMVGLVCLGCRRYGAAVSVLTVAALWAWLCCTPVFAAWLQSGLESQYPPQPAASYPTADAIVVLGGGTLPDSSHDWDDQDMQVRTTRVGFGLQLYRNGSAPIILLSGGDHEAERMSGGLLQQGVPARALRTEELSTTTHENALNSAIMLKREKRRSILLVTSALHMPRAAASFRRQGLTVIPAPALDTVQHPRTVQGAWWPERGALYLSSRCLREYLGLWGYWLRGWA